MKKLSECLELVEKQLRAEMDAMGQCEVVEAMRYSLLGKGKRLRPLFLLSVLQGYGKEVEEGLKVACALEMVHTYSLIHDDLPAMDNDDYRRGRLTCHKKFNEAVAILAGDGLLTQAFALAAVSSKDSEKARKIVSILAKAAGAEGMILGQELDIASESLKELTYQDLKKIHLNKTGRLFSAPLMMGCILADKEDKLELWETVGQKIGLAFQIQDDILDVTSTAEQLGKSTSDSENDKFTIVKLFGLEKSIELMNQEYNEAIELINQAEFDNPEFIEMLNGLASRKF